MLDLLVLDRDNLRSLGWVTQTLRGRLARLAENTAGNVQAVSDLTQTLPDPGSWILSELCSPAVGAPRDQPYASLLAQLERCCDAAFDLSNLLSRRYFSHVAQDERSLGA